MRTSNGYRGLGLRRAVLVLALAACAGHAAHACRYSVREVAFVDLSASHYTLTYHPAAGFADASRDALGLALAARFRGTDVRAEAGTSAEDKPTAVLAGVTGRTLEIPAGDVQDPAEALASALFGSPVQAQLLAAMPEHLCAAVLVHGTDAQATAAFRETVTQAAELAEARLPMLERPTKEGVLIIEVPPDAFDSERVVLWSLGIDAAAPEASPRLAAVFGRGRRFGPVFTSEGLTARKLADVFALAGASCECGLDRSWMQGPVVPLAWTRESKARVAAALGFDPENPMVALEMRQILAQAGAAVESATASLDDVPAAGYREMSLDALVTPVDEAAPASEPGNAPPQPVFESAGETVSAPPAVAEAVATPKAAPAPQRRLWVWTGAVAALLVVINVIVVVAVRRRGGANQ